MGYTLPIKKNIVLLQCLTNKRFIMETKEVKRCPHCGETKSVSEFSKCSWMADGLQTWCKLCFKNARKSNKHMKVFLFILSFCLCSFGFGQQIQKISSHKLKTTDMGNQFLSVVTIDSMNTYSITMKSRGETELGRYNDRLQVRMALRGVKDFVDNPPVVLKLGDAEKAIALLSSLLDELKNASKGDFFSLGNEEDNMAKYTEMWGVKAYRIYSPDMKYSGQLRESNIKGFIKAIRKYENEQFYKLKNK